MKLEAEYWSMKARGLQKKAHAIESKAKMLKESGQAPQIDILEMEAEAELTLAEVKLCEANAQRLKDSLAQQTDGRQSYNPLPPPTFATPPRSPFYSYQTGPRQAQPGTAEYPLSWDALRAANPQVSEEELLRTLLTAAAMASGQFQTPTVPGEISPSAAPSQPAIAPQPLYSVGETTDQLKAENEQLKQRLEKLEAEHAK